MNQLRVQTNDNYDNIYKPKQIEYIKICMKSKYRCSFDKLNYSYNTHFA